MQVTYKCQLCVEVAPKGHQTMICPYCGGDLRGEGCPTISGTRDQFGIGREFVDERTGRTIDNWKSWERAGYQNPLETTKNHKVKEMIKEKQKELKGKRQRQLTPQEMPV